MLLLLKEDAIGKMKIAIEKINRKIRSIWVSKLRYKKIYKNPPLHMKGEISLI